MRQEYTKYGLKSQKLGFLTAGRENLLSIGSALTNSINLKSLSQELGMSQTTVSRALNGFPEVSERTRQLVLKAAAKHNYKPNTRARRLATGKSMT